MADKYRILYEGGEDEIIVKKSRFIATVRPVADEEEAVRFIAEMKKKYWDARHNCSAFAIGKNHELTRCSDDGEPAQTAGRPMLNVLLGEDVHNVCVVVTRYFGGVLLGTGGLVRAYSDAVKAGLSACVILDKKRGFRVTVGCGYPEIGKIQYLTAEMGISALESAYGEQVSFTFLVPAGDYESFHKKLTEGTNGTARIERGDEVWYGINGKETVLFGDE